MGKWIVVWLVAGACLAAQQAPIPRSDELSGRPFAIEKKWVIGGAGNWDYLTLDPAARQLFIAHQSKVQVVDVDSGAVAGEVSGFGDAHSIALDPNGQVGYVSDGRANMIRFFDRRTFELTGAVPLTSSPRALVFEPKTGLLFAFGSMPAPAQPQRGAHPPPSRSEVDPCSLYGNEWPPPPAYQSEATIIDPAKRTKVAEVQICGVLGSAAADGQGQVYFAITNFNAVGRLDGPAVAGLARQRGPREELVRTHGSFAGDGILQFDFKSATSMGMLVPYFRVYGLGQECKDPRAVAVDAAHLRLFTGCANMNFKVVATDTGGSLASLTIGPGVDAMAYDPGRGLIFTANGGGYGSVTVIRQHVTDSYSVVQNLPTLQQARTIAVDPSSGLVYLVTTLYGANLTQPPMNGIGTLKLDPVEGSFQVLVVGN